MNVDLRHSAAQLIRDDKVTKIATARAGRRRRAEHDDRLSRPVGVHIGRIATAMTRTAMYLGRFTRFFPA
jgi:hypothetical protein